MAVTPEQAAGALLARAEQEQRVVAERTRLLVERAGAAAEALKRDYGAHRVILFGSLAWGDAHAASDVDLAVAGLSPERIDEAAADVERVVGVPVDLQALEAMPPSFAQRVVAEGVTL